MVTQVKTSDFVYLTRVPVVVLDTAGILDRGDCSFVMDCWSPRADPQGNVYTTISAPAVSSRARERPPSDR